MSRLGKLKAFNSSKSFAFASAICFLEVVPVSITRILKSFLAAFVVFCTLLGVPALAQYESGVSATVVDRTGAAIPGAELSLINQSTQVVQKAVANGQGYVQIMQLPPGTYKASVQANGFETWQLTDILVEGHDVRTIYPKLKVGEQNTTVSVIADTAQIEMTKGNIGRTLETKTVQESPMTGDDVYASVATLAPGVTGLGDASGNISSAGSVGTNSFAAESGFQINAAGQRQEANEYQVDGTVVDSDSRDGVVNITPEPETVQEIKVTASTFSAEKGRQSGALIEVFTKPGTNKFHGVLSEFHTDNALTARTEFQTAVPKTIRNDFGGDVGGPIIKNKTFFFGSIFYLRSILGNTLIGSVETPAFSNYVQTNFPNSIAAQFLKLAPPQIAPTYNFQTVGQLESSYGTAYTFPDIPTDLVAVGTTNINVSPISNGFQGHVRIDQNLRGDKDKLFFSLFRNTTQGESANPRSVYSYIDPNATVYAKFDYIRTFSPSLVNEAGISYVRFAGNEPQSIPSLPNIYYIGGISDTFAQYGPITFIQNNFIYNDVLSYSKGRHTIHIGIDVDRQQDFDNFTGGLVRPFFYFLSPLDFAADHPFYQSGPVIDLTTHQVANNLYQRVLELYVAPYVQDDWKVNRRLTINVGLRMDNYGHMVTVQNSHENIDFFTPGAGATLQDQIANGTMQTRGNNGDATTNRQYRFNPRAGFAFDVFGNGKTSLHGGYGVYSDKIGEYAYVTNIRTNPPGYADPSIDIFNAGTTFANFSYSTSPSGPTGFAPVPGVTYTIDSHGGLVGTRTSVGGVSPNLHAPTVQSWALGLQQAMGQFVFEADYLGTAARGLYIQTDVNRFAGDEVINNGNLTRLNQSFNTVLYGSNVGINNTNVGAFGISKSFAHHWTSHVTYTFGKSLDYLSSNDNGVGGGEAIFDAQHPERQYARSDYDSRHRLSADAVWDIPGTHGNRLLREVTSGFTVSPIVILQTGEPFTVYTSANYQSGGDYNGDGYDYDTPNAPSFGNTISVKRSAYLTGLFPASAFPKPALGQEGTLGRNTYSGPGFASVNLALQRSFRLKLLGDAGAFELRGEAINAFNRVNLAQPVSDLSNTSFGYSTGQYSPRQIQVVGHIRF
jgi:hypothetical protein